MSRRQLFLACVFLGSCLLECKGCGYFEEGKRAKLDCSVDGHADEIIWRGMNGGSQVDVAVCNIANNNCTETNSLYDATLSSSDTGHSSSLVIHSIKRNMTNWHCVIDGQIGGSCNLIVYVNAERPTCDLPVLPDSKKEIIVKCQTKRVYPRASCVFLHSGSPNKLTGILTYNHQPSHIDSEDFQTACILTSSLPQINQTSNIRFKVNMFPEGTSSQIGVSSDWTSPVELRLPIPAIASDCPSGSHINAGYIKSGSTATCICSLADTGYPPGQAYWTLNGIKTGTQNWTDGSSTLTFTFNSADRKPKYECGAESDVGKADKTFPFSPMFAYGPPTVSIELSHPGGFNLCPHETHGLEVTCKVQFGQVDPPPVFTVSVNTVPVSGPGIGSVISSYYTYSYTFRPDTTGNVRVTCKAENDKFSSLKVIKDTYIEAREPPSQPPVIMISNNRSVPADGRVSVKEGDEVEVSCTVDGGNPQVSNVTLTCGSSTRTNGDTAVTTTLRITDELQGGKCVCSAEHVTGCYNLEAEIQFDVSVFGEITLFSANGEHTSLDVDQGDDVTFKCAADGELTPDLVITRQGTTSSFKRNSAFGIEYQKNDMQCEDTNTYVCQAISDSNTVFAEKEVQVNVKCKPQLRHLNDEQKTYSGQPKKDVIITIDILVYPDPDSFSLRREQDSFLREVSDWKYSVKYQSKTAPLGTVTLTLLDLKSEDFGRYVLIIYNEVDMANGLKYRFQLDDESEKLKSESDNKKTIGLGVGLGCAVLAIIIILVIIFLYKRKRKIRQREARVIYDKTNPTSKDTHPYEGFRSSSSISNMSDIYLCPDTDMVSNGSVHTASTGLSGLPGPFPHQLPVENEYASVDEIQPGPTYHPQEPYQFRNYNFAPRY